MRKFAKEFWWTLTHPEDWHIASIIVVGIFFLWAFSETLGEAIDILY
ncbi:MAG: hypothetical protein IKA93_01850 [Elusimicrobiaceae bacterium]|nr:hypothetical protein [Elusimicrobiaceae bacterium]